MPRTPIRGLLNAAHPLFPRKETFAHPSFRRRPESRGAGTWGIPPITKITRITVQTTPLVSFVDNPRHSNRPPVIPAAAGIQGRGRGESHQSQKSHESQFRQPPSCPSWTIPVIPTAHPSFRRRPESRGAGTWGIPLIPLIPLITVQTTPFAPFVSFVDNPRHSNRPPVIPAAAGIQRGGDVGNPTNHKNPTNHSSDNSLRALSVLRG